jgi:chemotaxis protein MotA
MDLTTLLGVIVGVLAVVGAMIFKKISFDVFLNPAAFFVIFVGTVATILNSFPGKNLKSVGSLFKILFTNQKGITEVEIIKIMVSLALDVRKEGLLVLEKRMESIDDPFMKKAVGMIVDGAPEDYIEDTLHSEIEAMESRHEENASIFSSAGAYAPTLGVLGAVFGLIAAMSHIEDTEAMAEAIAAAFIATILGIFTGYVLWNPFAKKLKLKSQQEVKRKKMIIEGVISLQRGESTMMLKDKLLALLPQSKQAKVLEEINRS